MKNYMIQTETIYEQKAKKNYIIFKNSYKSVLYIEINDTFPIMFNASYEI